MDAVEMVRQGPAGVWLDRFECEPVEALEALLGGWASLGVLNAADPVTLLLDWLEVLGNDFASKVDSALAVWIGQMWGQSAPESMNQSSSLCAATWCNVASVIAGDARLKSSAQALKERVLDDRSFLDGLTEGRSRDPLAQAWLALARHRTDRELLNDWRCLCSLPLGELWYRGQYGVHGLGGLPEEKTGEERPVQQEVAEGLALLAASLCRLAVNGELDERLAREEFLRTARLTMVALPSDDWKLFWPQEAERMPERAPREWVNALAL